MENQLSRRKFLKTATYGLGLCMANVQMICADEMQERGRGRNRSRLPISPHNPSISLYQNRCRNCGRCTEFCRNQMTVFGHAIASGEDPCIYCGQCTLTCTRAISEKYHYAEVAKAIADPGKIVVAFIAPSIRVSLGEMFGLAAGTNVEGRTVAALKQLGVDYVFDATFAADLTVVEESMELLQRLDSSGGNSSLPMFTSCCPAWVRFAKLFYPHLIPNLSTVKSPLLMQGALVKIWFAQKTGIDPTKIVTVALAPCTAKKAEIWLPQMNAAATWHKKPQMRDVDFSLTTREIAYLLKDSKIDFLRIREETPLYNSFIGAGSGAGVIFGNSGGVMEAALRTAYKLMNNQNPPIDFFNFTPLRGLGGVRQANVNLGKRTLKVAVVHGTNAARPFIEQIQNGDRTFDFVEVMACSGGCIGGGGQPISRNTNVRQLRAGGLYRSDAGNAIRLSCDNPQIRAIYDEFLGSPASEKSKAILHIRH